MFLATLIFKLYYSIPYSYFISIFEIAVWPVMCQGLQSVLGPDKLSQLGIFVKSNRNSRSGVGAFSPTVGWEDLYMQRLIDAGSFYASKVGKKGDEESERLRMKKPIADENRCDKQSKSQNPRRLEITHLLLSREILFWFHWSGILMNRSVKSDSSIPETKLSTSQSMSFSPSRHGQKF